MQHQQQLFICIVMHANTSCDIYIVAWWQIILRRLNDLHFTLLLYPQHLLRECCALEYMRRKLKSFLNLAFNRVKTNNVVFMENSDR